MPRQSFLAGQLPSPSFSTPDTVVAEQPANPSQALTPLPDLLWKWMEDRDRFERDPQELSELVELLDAARTAVRACVGHPVPGGNMMESEATKEMELYARVGSIRRVDERFEATFSHNGSCGDGLEENVRRILNQINKGNPPISFGPPAQKGKWQLVKESLSLLGRFVLKQPALTAEQRAFFADRSDD